MSKKKAKGGRARVEKQPYKAPPGNFVDPRTMEANIPRLFAGARGESVPDTPLAKAQAQLQTAFETSDERRRVQIAKEALSISPDCADAYVLLAEYTRNRREALALHEQAVDAAKRALGPGAFERYDGHFWGVLETRPYMRARLELAFALWSVGRQEEAIAHLQEMLRLNPEDNQGVRYSLASFLALLERDDELARLLEQFPNDSLADFAYTKALLAFRRHGDTPLAREALERAKKTNRHVPAYLIGDKEAPSGPSGRYCSPGNESEALNYVGSFRAGWRAAAGAIDWLRARSGNAKKQPETPPAKGPIGFVKNWLNRHLRQREGVWQVEFRRTPNWMTIADEMVRPWTIIVMDASNDLLLTNEVSLAEPSSALLWDTLVQAMQHPAAGEPHRPTELQVRMDERWESLKPHAMEIGVKLTQTDKLDQIDAVFDDMCEKVCGEPLPGLLDMPGVTAEKARGFYDAAAFYFRQAPWKKLGDSVAVKIEADKFQSGPWYAVIMGQAGLTTGLALYHNLAGLRRIWSSNGTDEKHIREEVATCLIFGEEWTIPAAELDAAQKHGWPVARPDAYPAIFHKERGMAIRLPLAWELELMEGCLRAIPEFVGRHTLDVPAREEIMAPVSSGTLKLALSWAMDEPRATEF